MILFLASAFEPMKYRSILGQFLFVSARTNENGGKPCLGAREEWEPCSVNDCPVDGAWTEWSNWGYCDRKCGAGFRKRQKTCSNPKPENGGRPCEKEGDNIVVEKIPCKIKVIENKHVTGKRNHVVFEVQNTWGNLIKSDSCFYARRV